MEKMSISVVIPCYNEQNRIGKTLDRIIRYMGKKGHDYEIIVVSDGSKDSTVEVASKFIEQSNGRLKVIGRKQNLGKGGTVKEGMLAAKKDYVLFSDADLSTPIEELEHFHKYLQSYDVIIGSRYAKGADVRVKQPFFRVLVSRMFNILVSVLAVRGIKDTQCGFKLFSAKAAAKIFKMQKFNRFGFDVEILFIAKKHGFRIKEVPVVWVNSEESKVSAIKDSISMFTDLLKIRWNSLMGKYN